VTKKIKMSNGKKRTKIKRIEIDKFYQRIRKTLADEGKLVIPDRGDYEYHSKILQVDGVYDEDYSGGTDLIQIGYIGKDKQVYPLWVNLVEWCINAKKMNQIDTPPQYLDYWEDIEGLLKDIRRFGNKLILTFEIQAVIEIPYSQTYEDQLKQALEKKVGILRTDFPDDQYRFTIGNEESY